MSLGSAETTLMNLTAGYASFVMEKINPILINKIQTVGEMQFLILKSVNAKGVKNILITKTTLQ